MFKVLVFNIFAMAMFSMAFSSENIKELIANASKGHPRLFFNNKDVKELPKKIASDPMLLNIFEFIQKSADQIIQFEPLKHEKIGKRLLGVSREAIKRITFLSFTYLVTKDAKYAKRAETEMLTIANFKDWNPSHFLDVAEMTTALSIGYDWIYDTLEPASKEKIKSAIMKHGLIS